MSRKGILLELLAAAWDNVRVEAGRPVYFDNNATTPLDPAVVRAMERVQRRLFGNPSSLHDAGAKAREAVESARAKVARLIGAGAGEIVFTSGGTESNNTVLKGIARTRPGAHFVTTPVEHDSVLHVLRALEREGHGVTRLPVDRRGAVSPDDLLRALRPETALVSVIHLNNETGTVAPLEALAAVARERGVLFHSDAVQSLGKVPIDVRRLPVDYLSFSAHKIRGPKGIGALYVRSGAPFSPLLEGGHQEEERRAGTEGLVAIAGFGAAAERLARTDPGERAAALLPLKARAFAGIARLYPGARINGDPDGGHPGTLNVLIPGADNRELLPWLDYRKIAVSAGSACDAGSDAPSHVLRAIGLSDDEARSSIRISFGAYNTAREVDRFLAALGRFLSRDASGAGYVFPADLSPGDLARPGRILADIRTKAQRARARSLPQAVECGIGMAPLLALPKDREILLVCEDGYLSNLYAPRLRRAGRRVKSLYGGFKRWRQLHKEYYYFTVGG